VNARGETPLHLACAIDDAELVRALRAHGATVRLQHAETLQTPLHIAANLGNLAAAQALLKEESGEVDAEGALSLYVRDSNGEAPTAGEGSPAALQTLLEEVRAAADAARKERGRNAWITAFDDYEKKCSAAMVAVLDTRMEEGYSIGFRGAGMQ